jgi:hypothetical protein
MNPYILGILAHINEIVVDAKSSQETAQKVLCIRSLRELVVIMGLEVYSLKSQVNSHM